MPLGNRLLLSSAEGGGVPITSPSHPNLVVMYTMDNISGSTLVDESPNGNDGTISGATAVSGKIGNALQFTGHPDEVILPSISRVYTNGATQCAWVKFDGHNAVVDFILHDESLTGVSNTHRATIRWRPDLGEWALSGGNDTGFYGFNFPDTLPADGTYMFLLWKVDSSGNYTLKRDDTALSGSLFFGTQVSPTTTTVPMKLAGTNFTNTDRNLIGELDQYRYFDRLTTDAEDSLLFNGGVGA